MAVTRDYLSTPPAQQPRDVVRRAYLPLADSSLATEIFCDDTVSIEDTAGVELAEPGHVRKNDSVSVTDAALHTVAINRYFADTVGAVDASKLADFSEAFSTDTVTAVDAASYILAQALSPKNDTVSVTDARSVARDITRTFNDTVGAADAIGGDSASAPTVQLVVPGSLTDAEANSSVVLRFTDGLSAVVSAASIVVTVNGIIAWTAASPVHGWTGRLVQSSAGQCLLTLYPPQGFAYGTSVSVLITLNYGRGIQVNDTVSVVDASVRV